MSYFNPSILANAQVQVATDFASPEQKYTFPETMKWFIAGRDKMIPNYMELKKRDDLVLDTFIINRAKRSLTTAYSATHAGGKGDSTKVTPTWTPYSDGFAISLKQGDNNIFSQQNMLAAEIGNVFRNFAEDTETLASTYAHANRSGVNIATVDGSFDSTNDVFEIQDNLEKEAVNISKIVMKINKLNTANLVCFCDSISYRKFEFYANQGTGNSVNTSFQYSGVNFVHSVGLDALFGAMGYDLGAWIIAPAGTFGVMDWTPKQNREGFVEPGIAQYGVINNPLLGINHGFHMYAERSDAQGSGGYYQDVNYEWQFTTMLGFVKAPLTTATESVFQAFAIIPTVVA
jgi:hypothetical protein